VTVAPLRPWLTALAAFAALSACAQSSESCDECNSPPAPAAAPDADLPIRETIAPIVIDGSLDDWAETHVVVRIPVEQSDRAQWRCVRERCPASLSERDAGVTVFLAWSREPFLLYGGFDLLDDVVVPSRDSERPYSGDSVEIFLAADQLNFQFDYQALVAAPKSASQAAFAQIDVGPATAGRLADYVQDYRTDSLVKTRMTAGELAVSTRIDGPRWRAEVRIPLGAFADDVASRLRNDGARLAIGLTYLDYDDPTHASNPVLAAAFGYRPDNVFSPAIAESGVNTPAFMRRAYLAK
jgi:hypothetical protein